MSPPWESVGLRQLTDSDKEGLVTHARTQHPNAPLTPLGRRRMVACVLDQRWTVEMAAERFQVDAKTVRKWRDRFLTEGSDGLLDRRRTHCGVWCRRCVACWGQRRRRLSPMSTVTDWMCAGRLPWRPDSHRAHRWIEVKNGLQGLVRKRPSHSRPCALSHRSAYRTTRTASV